MIYRRIKHSYFYYIFLAMMLAVPSYAIDYEDVVYPELVVSGRALGMGNAFICKVDDSSAAFYNPAGLGTVRKGHFHLSNVYVEANKGWMDIGAGGKISDAASNFSKGFSLEGTRELLVDNPGKISHSRFQLMPNMLTRYFSAGYMLSKLQRATVTSANSDGEFEYATRLDHGPYAALNISLFGGILKFGATGVILSRSDAQDSAPKATTIDLQDNDYNKGTMALVISGARLTLPFEFLPTFAVVQRNSFSQKFSGRAAGAPETIKNQIDVGFSITPQIGSRAWFHLEANYKDISNLSPSVSTNRKIVFGGELDFARVLQVRLGYGDGFGSFGLGIRTKKLDFDITSYAVDSTASEFRGREDRRYSLMVSTGF